MLGITSMDLWPNVNAPAPRWEFVLADQEISDSVPEVERVVVEAAGKRDRERQRTERRP